mgnify:CR=1 FL=1|jgi:hypothetical protein
METENKTNLKEPELLEYHGADSIANLEPPDKEPPSNNRENKLFLAFNITVAIIGVILLYSAWGNHRLGAAVILALIPANIARRKGYSYKFWYLYGLLLWIFAVIHIIILKSKPSNLK